MQIARNSVAYKDEDNQQHYIPYASAAGDGGVMAKRVKTRMMPWGDHCPWTESRDVHLQLTVCFDDQWGNAVQMYMTKFASHGFELENKFATRLNVAQEALTFANFGRGFVSLLTDIAWDDAMTANGAFVEIVRKSASSKIEQINCLESGRCIRTGDRKFPVQYRLNSGKYIKLPWWKVLLTEDKRGQPFTRPGRMCAAQSVYKTIYHQAILNQRLLDVDAASKFTRIAFVGGSMDGDAIAEAIEAGEENVIGGDEERHGSNSNAPKYDFGTLMIPFFGDSTNAGKINSLDLLTRPTPEQMETDRKQADLKYANAVGIRPSELNPDNVTRIGMNSGAELGREADQVNSRGAAALVSWFEHAMTHYALPNGTTFTMVRPSLDEQLKEEKLKQERAKTLQIYVNSGMLDAAEARNMLGDAGDIPSEFNEPDVTDGGKLTDNSGEEKSLNKKEQSFDTESAEFNELFSNYESEIDALSSEAAEYAGNENRTTGISPDVFRRELESLIRDFMTQAFVIGADADLEDIDAEGIEVLDENIVGAVARIVGFADDIYTQNLEDDLATKASLRNRLSFWKQKLIGLFNLGKTYDPRDPILRHVLGGTVEHCSTCLELDGQERRGREWRESGFVPRNPPNDNYECGGWRCDCRLMRV